MLFTLGPSRQFSSTPELINEPFNERQEGEGERERETYFSLTPALINDYDGRKDEEKKEREKESLLTRA